jgi:hypothetical protein
MPLTNIPKACPPEGRGWWPVCRAIRAGFSITPISASWINAVENFFSKMTRQRIRRGIFRSVADLQAAINAYLGRNVNERSHMLF